MPYLWLIKFIGVLVPRRLRADWRQEWEAELRYREELLAEWDNLNWKTKLDLLRRSLGAFRDALLLQPQRLEDEMFQDLRFGARMLVKHKGFTVFAILSLALGIGANTALFGVVDRLLVRRLPVNAPEQLVNFSGRDPDLSWPTYLDYRDQNDVFDGLLAYKETPLNLSESGQSERITGALVSGNYFDVLGVSPALGRAFLPEEDRTPGTHPVAVVSYGLWQRRFGADPKLVGRAITLNAYSFTVIGVAPPEFRGVRRGVAPDVYVPVNMIAQAWPTQKPEALSSRYFSWLNLMGRLKPGVSRAQAEASLSALLSRMMQVYPNASGPSFELTDGSQGETGMVRDLRTPLKLLMATVALTLLIACVNVANLLMARAAVRRRELAVRVAVGASRLRLIRQMLTESMLLSLLGGVFGVALAFWLSDLLAAYSPTGAAGGSAPPLLDARLDWRVLAFTISLSLLTGLVFGLLPAWQSSKPNLTVALKEEAGSGGVGSVRVRLRSALVLAQIALALVVLVCAGLCVRSLRNLQRIDAGFEAARVLVVGLDVSLNGYTEEQGRQFYTALLERVSALPGVEAATLADGVPLSGDRRGMSVIIEGYSPPNPKRPGVAFGMNVVGPRYCATLKMALAAGREFTAQDAAGAAPVAIINEAAARAYWPNQNPVGKRLLFPGPNQRSAEIVGVVRDSRYRGLTEPVRPALLLPIGQHYSPSLALHLRSAGAPAALIGAVRSEARALDPRLPLTRIRTLEEQRGAWLYSERVTALLLAAFGGVALLLAGLGIYGVTAYAVTQRTREIGVRMALGAQAADVVRLVLRQGVWLIAAGVTLGLAGALAATRLVKGFLYDVSATDPLTFVAVTLLLAGVALLACYLPARRATKVDPLVALRYE